MDVPRAPKKKTARAMALAGIAVGLLTLVILAARLRPADPAVDTSSIVVAQVARGPMVISVRGAGRLVPQHVRFVTAVTGGRVEQVAVQAGSALRADTMIVQLSNPEVELQTVQAQQQMIAAEAQLTDTKRTLEAARLLQESQLAATRSDYEAARRDAAADAELAERQFVSREQARRSAERAKVLAARLEDETEAVELLRSSARVQYNRLAGQIQRLREIVDFHRARQAALQVRAGAAGVVQDLSLQPGQWVQPGTTVARIVEPGGLKAELRVSQVQARDVRIGQRALVDTRSETVAGTVTRVDPNVREGFVTVEAELSGSLPESARPDLAVDGTIVVDELADVLYVDRPAGVRSAAVSKLFKVEPDSESAVRVPVQLGRASAKDLEVRAGLSEGDRIIVSDMSAWDRFDRVRLR